MSKKILIIGLDGTTFNFIDPLIAKGRLPVLAKLMKEGIRSPLETIFPPITSAAWTSFITGKNPGKHGSLNLSNVARVKPVKLRLMLHNVAGKLFGIFFQRKNVQQFLLTFLLLTHLAQLME
ncbi:MAG: alkaline phosphatase family protein [Blastocatellia bacterium]|nr:alkaline phosphatase family protein [Blastocatellia bacterium]